MSCDVEVRSTKSKAEETLKALESSQAVGYLKKAMFEDYQGFVDNKFAKSYLEKNEELGNIYMSRILLGECIQYARATFDSGLYAESQKMINILYPFVDESEDIVNLIFAKLVRAAKEGQHLAPGPPRRLRSAEGPAGGLQEHQGPIRFQGVRASEPARPADLQPHLLRPPHLLLHQHQGGQLRLHLRALLRSQVSSPAHQVPQLHPARLALPSEIPDSVVSHIVREEVPQVRPT
jgi:hypothetical protein